MVCSLDFILQLANIVLVFVALAIAICTLVYAKQTFKRNTTLQMEMYMLDTHNNLLDKLNAGDTNAKIQFLVAVDLYCKYVVNGHLDSKLADDNLNFYESIILAFKDEIGGNDGYNNIYDYVKKYNIILQE